MRGERAFRIAALFLLILSGCAAPQVLSTPSGRPEVTIRGAKKKAVTDALVSRLLAKGWVIKTVNEYQLIFERDAEGAAGFLLSSRYDPTVKVRMSFALVDESAGVHVTGRADYVTNPGSAFERLTDATVGQSAVNIQDSLEQVRNLLELAAGYPPAPSSTAPRPRAATSPPFE